MSNNNITRDKGPGNPPSILEIAIVLLDSFCDGAQTRDGKGFNKIDAPVGHRLAGKFWLRKKWTSAEIHTARRLVRKYSKQLSDIGYNIDDILGSPDSNPDAAGDIMGLVDRSDLLLSSDGEAFTVIDVGKRREVCFLSSSSFGDWLRLEYHEVYGSIPGRFQIDDAIRIMIAMAKKYGDKRPVFRRVAEHDGAIYIDLCNEDGQCVKVTAEGWSVLDEPPVFFVRSKDMGPLPIPVRNAGIRALRPFLNVASDDEFRLIVAWLVYSLRPKGPFPLLYLRSGQGSGKTSMSRVIRDLVDPANSELSSPPKDDRDLAVMAQHSYVVAIDNASSLTSWLSDALCRMCTGSTLKTRALYTNDDLVTLRMYCPVIVNSIEDSIGREDLRDRSIVIDLPRLENSCSQDSFRDDFIKAWAGIFAALLDGLKTALCNRPKVQVSPLPRMADFALFGTAMESAFGWQDGSFMAAYRANICGAAIETVDGSSIGTAIVEFARKVRHWEGTPTQLLRELQPYCPNRQDPGWPKSANQLSRSLNRLEKDLRAAGLEYKRYRRKTRTISIDYIGDPEPQLPLLSSSVDASMEIGPSTTPESHDKLGVTAGIDGIDAPSCRREKEPDIDHWDVDDGEDEEDNYYREDSNGTIVVIDDSRC